MTSPRIYVETSVISYLTARPSRDLLVAARQEATREWWDRRDRMYVPLVSNLVLQETACGDTRWRRDCGWKFAILFLAWISI